MAKKTTKKQKQNMILILIIVVALVVIVWLFRQSKTENETSSTGSSSGGSSSSSSLPKLGSDATLKKGTKSQEVKYIQNYYNQKIAVPSGKTKLAVDGIFGSKTEAVVKTIVWKNWTTWNEFKGAVDAANNPALANNNVSAFPESEFEWQLPN